MTGRKNGSPSESPKPITEPCWRYLRSTRLLEEGPSGLVSKGLHPFQVVHDPIVRVVSPQLGGSLAQDLRRRQGAIGLEPLLVDHQLGREALAVSAATTVVGKTQEVESFDLYPLRLGPLLRLRAERDNLGLFRRHCQSELA